MMNIDRCALLQTIRIFLVGLIAIIISFYFSSDQNYWIILSALFLIQIRVGDVIQEHFISQLFSGLVAAIVVLTAACLGENIFLLAVFLSVTSFVSVYMGFRKVNLFLPACLVNLLGLISGGLGESFNQAVVRSEFVLGGMIVAISVTLLVWPDLLSFKFKAIRKHCLKTNLKLLQVIFNIYLKKDYTEKHFFYEKEIYFLSRLFASQVKVFRNLCARLNREECFKQLEKINKIFEIVMGLGALRYRVKDHTTWGMVNQELKDIFSVVEKRFNLIIQGTDISINDNIEGCIDRFDEVYASALQVASQEPLVYLFFVWDLRSLSKELNE